MRAILPIIEGLEGAATHAERADWLLRCPISILFREHMTIRPLLQRTGLQAGIEYLEAMQAYASATRTPDGTSFPTVLDAVRGAAEKLRAAV